MQIKLLKYLSSAASSVMLFKMMAFILALFVAANVASAARYIPDINTENTRLTSVYESKAKEIGKEEEKYKFMTQAAYLNATHVAWYGSSTISYEENFSVSRKGYRCESSKKGRCAIIK